MLSKPVPRIADKAGSRGPYVMFEKQPIDNEEYGKYYP
jgi:hypothetical protein